MTQSYLNGKVHLSSLAAPNEDDLRVLRALSDDERRALVEEAVELGRNSGTSTKTPEEIWEAAKARAASYKTSEHVR